MTTPVSHLVEAQKLTADSLVDLYEIALKQEPVIFRFKNNDSVNWQGYLYEGMACSLSGDSRSADGEEARPLLRVLNPFGIFNQAAINGQIDLAIVYRKRILRQHLDSNTLIFEQKMWYVSRIRELISGQSISMELRVMSEGPNYMIPVRQFLPPEFPTVSL